MRLAAGDLDGELDFGDRQRTHVKIVAHCYAGRLGAGGGGRHKAEGKQGGEGVPHVSVRSSCPVAGFFTLLFGESVLN